MANLNNEGFAIAPRAECVNGLKPVFYTDDSNTGRPRAAHGQDRLHPDLGARAAATPRRGGTSMPGGQQADRTAPR